MIMILTIIGQVILSVYSYTEACLIKLCFTDIVAEGVLGIDQKAFPVPDMTLDHNNYWSEDEQEPEELYEQPVEEKKHLTDFRRDKQGNLECTATQKLV